MAIAFAWIFGIVFAVWCCRALWKARRDAQMKKMIAAGMAADIAGQSVEAALGDGSSDWNGSGTDGADGDGD